MIPERTPTDIKGLREEINSLKNEFKEIQRGIYKMEASKSEWEIRYMLKNDLFYSNSIGQTALVPSEVMILISQKKQLALDYTVNEEGVVILLHNNVECARFPMSFLTNINRICEKTVKYLNEREVINNKNCETARNAGLISGLKRD